ncbi:MAG: hypothetical protein BMS9Abin26_1587 [Gammaproteobacteria bacterium]|nr:MAG: hypothetical protein BMS9Abin26_1587 [Gammaproteobacteria bacterium]
MQAIEQALISFFEQVAQKNKSWLKKLKQEQCFSVDQWRWCFTLPDLYLFLQHQDDIYGSIDYKQFRQLIFNSPINQAVKLYGAEITITDNQARVDRSGYALVWLARNLQHMQTDALKFVHITDPHLLDQPEETFHSLNTRKNLEAVLSDSLMRYPDIDFLLFTGDISQTGSEESYTLFNSLVQQYDLPIYCIPGNHDTPELLQHVIPNCPDKSINIIQSDKFSLVLLNSRVENREHGMITQHCLQQLEEHLKNGEDQFNIIAIHHPPVLINSRWLDEIGLLNKTEFLQTINKYPRNTLLLFGHVHQEIDQQLDNLRLLATPSTCYQFKANSEYMHRIDTPSAAYRFVKLSTKNNIETKVHYVE